MKDPSLRKPPDPSRRFEEVLRGERPPRFYIASALSNAVLNLAVEQTLVTHSWSCFLPQRDAPANATSGEIAAANGRGILEADILLALAYKMGRDTAWEVGFATAHGIPIVLVYPTTVVPEHDLMLFHSASAVLSVAPENLAARLHPFLEGVLTQLRGLWGGA